MNELLEFLKIILPAIAILAIVYVMMREFTKQNSKQFDYLKSEQELLRTRMKNEKKSDNIKTSMPLKFQAYERMSLFLERINPPNLLTRVVKPKMSTGILQASLLSTIREEYEHNMSQQLYISDKAWELVKAAKEDVVRTTNSSAAKFKSDEDSGNYAQNIITSWINNKNNSIELALTRLKKDIRENFA